MAATGAGAAAPNSAAVIMDGKSGANGASHDTPGASLGSGGGGLGCLCTGIGYGLNSPIIDVGRTPEPDFTDDLQLPLHRLGLPVTEVIAGFGNGGSRDDGSQNVFPMKMVTATGAVAVGVAVEPDWINRSTRALVSGESVHGSANGGAAAPVVPAG